MSRRVDTSSTTWMVQIMGKHWRSRGTSRTKSWRSSISRTIVGKTSRSSFMRTWTGENSELGMCVRSSETRVIFVRKRGRQKMAGKKQNVAPKWKKLMTLLDIDEPTSFLDHVYLGCTQRECKPNETSIEQCTKLFESRISAGSNRKLLGWEKHQAQTVAWSYDMEGHAQKCVERFCELANKKVEQLYKVSSPCLDDDLCKQEELESVVEISQVCSHNFWECLYLARDDLTSCGPWTSLQDQSRNGLRHVTND